MLAQQKAADLVDLCYNKLDEYSQGKDLVVINGWRNGGSGFNAALAKGLDAPVLMSMDLGADESKSQAFERAACIHPHGVASLLHSAIC
jgi:hypothetical protein